MQPERSATSWAEIIDAPESIVLEDYMTVVVEIEQDGGELRVVELEFNDQEAPLIAMLAPIAERTGIPVEELILDIGVGNVQFHRDSKLGECLQHGHRWRHRRVCVDMHFESEQARHFFPARATWAHVHRWGCHRFDVPKDACANLELHEGSPSGPVLNDRIHIGRHKGCKVVWLVKPGPEPYGGR